MAGPIQGAVNTAIGTTAAAIGVKKGIELKETKQAEQAAKEEKQAEAMQRNEEIQGLKSDILKKKLEIETSKAEREKSKTKSQALKAAQMQQRAKENYLNIIKEKQLGTKLGTRTSMRDYIMYASGGTLSKDDARDIARTMTDSQKRKLKEQGGATSVNDK